MSSYGVLLLYTACRWENVPYKYDDGEVYSLIGDCVIGLMDDSDAYKGQSISMKGQGISKGRLTAPIAD